MPDPCTGDYRTLLRSRLLIHESGNLALASASLSNVVLEVKAQRGPIRVRDARQLSDWVRLVMYQDDDSEPEEWKGLLIGNPHCNQPLSERAT